MKSKMKEYGTEWELLTPSPNAWKIDPYNGMGMHNACKKADGLKKYCSAPQ
jgi:hypothetical protein